MPLWKVRLVLYISWETAMEKVYVAVWFPMYDGTFFHTGCWKRGPQGLHLNLLIGAMFPGPGPGPSCVHQSTAPRTHTHTHTHTQDVQNQVTQNTTPSARSAPGSWKRTTQLASQHAMQWEDTGVLAFLCSSVHRRKTKQRRKYDIMYLHFPGSKLRKQNVKPKNSKHLTEMFSNL